MFWDLIIVLLAESESEKILINIYEIEDNMSQSFEDLEVWKKSGEIRNVIFKMVKLFPKIESHRLSDNMIRSSRSIGDNIAAGFGTNHREKNITSCHEARGAAAELLNQLITAHDCNYIEEFTFNKNKEEISFCISMIDGYIKYLKQAQKTELQNSEPGNVVKEINRLSLEAIQPAD